MKAYEFANKEEREVVAMSKAEPRTVELQ